MQQTRAELEKTKETQVSFRPSYVQYQTRETRHQSVSPNGRVAPVMDRRSQNSRNNSMSAERVASADDAKLIHELREARNKLK